MVAELTSNWLIRGRGDTRGAKLRLYAVPFAGRGASLFHSWRAMLPEWIDLVAVQLPGREARLREPALSSVADIVDALQAEIVATNDRPFAFFGYSMGALISFETTRALLAAGTTGPEALILAGHQPPHVKTTSVPFHAMTDAEFVDAMQRLYDGIPQEVLSNPDLMRLLLPTLRRDIEALEFFQFKPGPRLNIPFHVYGGTLDPQANRSRLERWQDLTNGPTAFRWFDGGHFFVLDQSRAVVDAVVADLSTHVAV